MPSLSLPFYEAAAQVLPILILALAVGELRLRADPGEGPLSLYFSLGVISLLLFAELVSFAALADDAGTQFDAAVVLLALMVGSVGLLIQFGAFVAGEAQQGGNGYFLAVLLTLAVVVVLGGGAAIYFQAR